MCKELLPITVEARVLGLNPWAKGKAQNYHYTISCSPPTDIEKRSQNFNIAPCNVVVSHGAVIGGIQVFDDHTGGNKRKQNASTIFVHHVAFHKCLFSCSDHSTYTPGESQKNVCFCKTQIPPIEAPCRDIDGSGCGISSLYLCPHPNLPMHSPSSLLHVPSSRHVCLVSPLYAYPTSQIAKQLPLIAVGISVHFGGFIVMCIRVWSGLHVISEG